MTEHQVIRAIIFRDGPSWVGQCLEYDIGAQADSLEDLHARLRLAIKAERRESIKINGTPFAGIDPAPKHFHDLWAKTAGKFEPIDGGDDNVFDVETRLCA